MRLEVDARVRRRAGFTLEAAFSCETDALALVGPSGCGKSTLLDSVAGIEPGARVVLDGVDCSGLPLHGRGFGYVTQDALLFPHLTVRANLTYSPSAGPIEAAARALGIESLLDRMPRNLSGGERRRVALARAVVSRPRLLLLDEPFGGLDEKRRREAMSLLDHVRQTFRIPMILVSHVADEVIGLSDHAIRLDAGRIVERGSTVAVLRASETHIDNYFEGEVAGRERVRVDGVDLHAVLPEGTAGRVRLACYAHDILLARTAPEAISARNVFPIRVARMEALEDLVIVELERPRLRVLVTEDAARSLDLRPGTEAYAVIKATSIEHLGAA